MGAHVCVLKLDILQFITFSYPPAAYLVVHASVVVHACQHASEVLELTDLCCF